jgi:hypothetical protein
MIEYLDFYENVQVGGIGEGGGGRAVGNFFSEDQMKNPQQKVLFTVQWTAPIIIYLH